MSSRKHFSTLFICVCFEMYMRLFRGVLGIIQWGVIKLKCRVHDKPRSGVPESPHKLYHISYTGLSGSKKVAGLTTFR